MKKILSIMVATLISATTFAQLSIWDGTDDVWTKGAGTESSPYLIESAQQLAFIASMVNGGVTTYENTYFKLMTNIDLNNLTWVPIGESTTKCFKGNFDGNNKSIYNSNTALMGNIKQSKISKINLSRICLIGNRADSSIIKSCTYLGSQEMIASINDGEIVDCRVFVNNTINNKSHATLASDVSNCVVRNCIAYGHIKTTYNKTEYELGKYYAYLDAAGLVSRSVDSKYYNCQSRTRVESVNPTYPVVVSSGMLGHSSKDSIFYCSNTAKCSGRYHNRRNDGTGYVDSCFVGFVGIGQVSPSYIFNSYTVNSDFSVTWDWPYTSGPTKSAHCINSYSSSTKTEQAMKSASFPIVLNTDSTVFIKDVTPNVNDGYPIYVNQVYAVTDTLTTISFTTSQLQGHYYALNADSVGFEYKEASDNTHWYKSVIGQISGNVVTCDLSNLTVGTNYVYRLWVARDGVQYFGDVLEFTTLECSKSITPLAASICQGEEYTFNGQQLTQSGTYRDTLVATNGCDSIIELTLTVMPTANIDKYDTIMVGESYDFYGNILTESGNYEHYVPMVNRCNLIILHLYVRQPDVTLTVNVNDPLMGSVAGAGSYEKYTERTINAVPNDGYHFVQWNDGVTMNPRTISLTQDTTFTAQFVINQYTISVTCNPQQGFIEGESGTFNHGTELTYKANANEGYHFVQWNDGVKDNPRTIVITKKTTLSAEFALDTYTLSVTCNTAQGRISGTSGVFEHGTSHNFEAIPNTGYHFIQWSDEVIDNPRTIVLTQDSILSAKFAINVYLVQFFGFNDVLIDSQSVEHGKAAVAPEIPSVEHYDFVGWDKEFTNVTADLDVFAIYQENTEVVENVNANALPRKIVIDSQIYILRGGKTYTLQGQEVK